MDHCSGVLLLQLREKLNKRSLLCFVASVAGLGLVVQPPDIAHADGVSVVPLAVSTDFFDGSARMNKAIDANHKVLADSLETTLLVPARNISNCHILLRECGCAMDNNFIDLSHCYLI